MSSELLALNAKLMSYFLAHELVGIEKISSPQLNGLEQLEEGVQLELLGWHALINQKPGWGYICFRGAIEKSGVQSTSQETLTALCDAIMEGHFPTFENDAEALMAVRSWAMLRLEELRTGKPASEEGNELRHRWLLGLLATRQRGVALRMDFLTARLGLSAGDRTTLWVLASLPGEHLLPMGELLALLNNEMASKEDWASHLDPRSPLLEHALVHLNDSAFQGGDLRLVEIDESVMAWLSGRDAWPHILVDAARWNPPKPVTERMRTTPATEKFGRAMRNPAGSPTVVLGTEYPPAALSLIMAWATDRQRQVIQLLRELSPSEMRVLLREAKLREALVIMAQDTEPESLSLASLVQAKVPAVLVLNSERARLAKASLTRCVAIGVKPPGREARALYWRDSLSAIGLTPPKLQLLDEKLGDCVLYRDQVADIVATVASEAFVAADGERQPEVSLTLFVQAARERVNQMTSMSGEPETP